MISLQGNANQNHNKTTLHTHWDDYHGKKRDNKHLLGHGKTGTLIYC